MAFALLNTSERTDERQPTNERINLCMNTQFGCPMDEQASLRARWDLSRFGLNCVSSKAGKSWSTATLPSASTSSCPISLRQVLTDVTVSISSSCHQHHNKSSSASAALRITPDNEHLLKSAFHARTEKVMRPMMVGDGSI